MENVFDVAACYKDVWCTASVKLQKKVGRSLKKSRESSLIELWLMLCAKTCAEQRRRQPWELRAHAHGFSVVKPSGGAEWSSILVVPAPPLKKDGIPS